MALRVKCHRIAAREDLQRAHRVELRRQPDKALALLRHEPLQGGDQAALRIVELHAAVVDIVFRVAQGARSGQLGHTLAFLLQAARHQREQHGALGGQMLAQLRLVRHGQLRRV